MTELMHDFLHFFQFFVTFVSEFLFYSFLADCEAVPQDEEGERRFFEIDLELLHTESSSRLHDDVPALITFMREPAESFLSSFREDDECYFMPELRCLPCCEVLQQVWKLLLDVIIEGHLELVLALDEACHDFVEVDANVLVDPPEEGLLLDLMSDLSFSLRIDALVCTFCRFLNGFTIRQF